MKAISLFFIFFPGLIIAGEINLEEVSKAVVSSIKNRSVDEALYRYLPDSDQLKRYVKTDEYFHAPDGFNPANPKESFKNEFKNSIDDFHHQYGEKGIIISEIKYVSSDYDELYNTFQEIKLNIWIKDSKDDYLLEIHGIKKFEDKWMILPGLHFSVFGGMDEKTRIVREVFNLVRARKIEKISSKILNAESYQEIDKRMLAGFEVLAERLKSSGNDIAEYKKAHYEDKLPSKNFDSLSDAIKKSIELLYEDQKVPSNGLKFYKMLGHSYDGSGSGENKIGHFSNLTFSVIDSLNTIYVLQVNDVYVFNDNWVMSGDLTIEEHQDKRLTSRITEGKGTKTKPYIISGEGIHIIPENPLATDTSYFLIKRLTAEMEVILKHQFSYEATTYFDEKFSQQTGMFFSSSSYYSGPEESVVIERGSSDETQDVYIAFIKDIDKEDENAPFLPALEFKVIVTPSL